ncbi:MAG: hypothetical protein PF961_10765 [Planctomycetota bacterium]|nr:hypothetical protein [Planctomycetota bacterium]
MYRDYRREVVLLDEARWVARYAASEKPRDDGWLARILADLEAERPGVVRGEWALSPVAGTLLHRHDEAGRVVAVIGADLSVAIVDGSK